MNAQELREEYRSLYEHMAQSKNPDNMKAFGHVMNEMMDWMVMNKPEAAQEWIEKLQAIKWKNYLTAKEADAIVSAMEPKAPWSREQWKAAMEQNGFALEKEPCYNRCALYATMNMLMSDSSDTFNKYIADEELFAVVHDLAVDKLTDKDMRFKVREYFSV
jgi:hypothetical protein